MVKPPGRWLLIHESPDAFAYGGEAWVAEDLNGAGVGGAAPTLLATLDLLEAADRRLALAKLAHPRVGRADLKWGPDVEETVGLLVVGVELDPWPTIEDSEDSEADEDDLVQRTCIREDHCDSLNAEPDARNARMKMRNPCRCYQCLMRQLAVAIDIGPTFTGVAFSNIPHMAIFPSTVAQPVAEMLPDREPEPESEAVEVSSVLGGVPGRSERFTALVVGDAALALPSVRRPLNALVPPNKGLGMDWSALEAVWRHSYTNVLCVEPSDHALLMTEPPVNSVATRERLTTLAFTTLRVPSFYLCNTSGELRVVHHADLSSLVLAFPPHSCASVASFNSFCVVWLQYSRYTQLAKLRAQW
eukprot:COSAG02_NODE_3209_length_7165_cov_31.071752_9_plen_359_part_00